MRKVASMEGPEVGEDTPESPAPPLDSPSPSSSSSSAAPSTPSTSASDFHPAPPRRRWFPVWPGPVLILVGLYFLASNLGLLNWVNWAVLWPVVLVLLGLWLIVRRR